MSDGSGAGPRVSEFDRVKQEYTQAARQILQRSMKGVARTKLTPDMLTLAGVSLCLAGAVLVGFEERNAKLFFWLGGILFIVGSVADILDGALARAASKGTVFGAFLDSTFDRLGEAAMLASIGLVFAREGNDIALAAAFAAVIGSFLVSYTRAKAEALGLRGGRRLRLACRAGGADLRGARPRPVGLAAVADLPACDDGLAHGDATHPLRAAAAARPRCVVASAGGVTADATGRVPHEAPPPSEPTVGRRRRRAEPGRVSPGTTTSAMRTTSITPHDPIAL